MQRKIMNKRRKRKAKKIKERRRERGARWREEKEAPPFSERKTFLSKSTKLEKGILNTMIFFSIFFW